MSSGEEGVQVEVVVEQCESEEVEEEVVEVEEVVVEQCESEEEVEEEVEDVEEEVEEVVVEQCESEEEVEEVEEEVEDVEDVEEEEVEVEEVVVEQCESEVVVEEEEEVEEVGAEGTSRRLLARGESRRLTVPSLSHSRTQIGDSLAFTPRARERITCSLSLALPPVRYTWRCGEAGGENPERWATPEAGGTHSLSQR
ncbi:unnamed protein product [Lampetra planeri]